ncbi:putative repair and recombination protein [Synechococcus phage S-CRM01]|uniref:UvsY-like recombination mediator n=1 Tax=Synechococcus phage S-CRM01 TaxID=1026955 RepID=UPI000209E358|nr:UvsY-like recombination mediator [Synechococcus phage S-CRM01]AEC52993.1 putative repair and recombination protein [Synechococcus phage S-CRM01]
MDLKTIQDWWKEDSKIDEVLLDESSLKIPRLHQKYLTLYNEFTIGQKRKAQQLKKLRHSKYLYYSGKADPQIYVANPFPHRLLKTDVQEWIGVDDEVAAVEMELEYYNTTVAALDNILKQIHQMSFNIKNAIEWRKFTSGG